MILQAAPRECSVLTYRDGTVSPDIELDVGSKIRPVLSVGLLVVFTFLLRTVAPLKTPCGSKRDERYDSTGLLSDK